jgi:hypothetical protein
MDETSFLDHIVASARVGEHVATLETAVPPLEQRCAAPRGAP